VSARSRKVTSSDGTQLAVYESGAADAPTVVLVHGFPDNHHLWDDIVDLLEDDFHVVTYDVRGAGASGKPAGRSAYRMRQLIDDLLAVLDAVSPDRPVHLVGHDWGSIQSWPAITDNRTAGRVATFTSLSGPSLDYAALWVRQVRQHPRASLRQFMSSYYVALFQLPRLPELAAKRGAVERGARRVGRPSSDGAQRAAVAEDAKYGIQLYRANMMRRLGRPRPVPVDLPVHLVVAEQDEPVTAEMVVGATRPWVADLTVSSVSGGHWTVNREPVLIAGLIRDFVRSRATAGTRAQADATAAQMPTASSRASRSSFR
jgi:pimeloyl-ACP methyl ester carboxylesterase